MVSQSRGGHRDWLLYTWSTFDLGFAFRLTRATARVSVALDLSFHPVNFFFLLWIFVNKLDFDSWDQRGDEEHFLPCMDPISLEHNEINGLLLPFT